MSLNKKFGDDFIWSLKYRPKDIENLLVPDRIKNDINNILSLDEMGNMIFYGLRGTGKTTAAIIISEITKRETIYINGSNETSIEVLRGNLTQFVTTTSFNGKKKLVIVDEADGKGKNQYLQGALKSFIETYSKNANFIFITNFINYIDKELLSRLTGYDFSFSKKEQVELKKQFAKTVLSILDTEKVEYNKKVLAHLINQYFPDMRKCLNELQGKKNRLTDIGILHEFTCDMDSYYEILKKRDFNNIQLFCANVTDSQNFYSKIYETCRNFIEPNDIPSIIILTNEYAYKSGFVVDQRINLVAYSCEIMNNIKIKD